MTRMKAAPSAIYDADCRACQRLASFLDKVQSAHPTYFCKPVPPFGDANASLLVVGLAPGMHGANASGRPFTGDYAGVILYETLHAFGFASRPKSVSADDGLVLTDCRLTNAVKCLPPDNKPTTAEEKRCNRFLANELRTLPANASVLALGHVAHDAVLRAIGASPSKYKFGHNVRHAIPAGDGHPAFALFDSYHCSRYNTNTRRLTPAMFTAVFEGIRDYRAAGHG